MQVGWIGVNGRTSGHFERWWNHQLYLSGSWCWQRLNLCILWGTSWLINLTKYTWVVFWYRYIRINNVQRVDSWELRHIWEQICENERQVLVDSMQNLNQNLNVTMDTGKKLFSLETYPTWWHVCIEVFSSEKCDCVWILVDWGVWKKGFHFKL